MKYNTDSTAKHILCTQDVLWRICLIPHTCVPAIALHTSISQAAIPWGGGGGGTSRTVDSSPLWIGYSGRGILNFYKTINTFPGLFLAETTFSNYWSLAETVFWTTHPLTKTVFSNQLHSCMGTPPIAVTGFSNQLHSWTLLLRRPYILDPPSAFLNPPPLVETVFSN